MDFSENHEHDEDAMPSLDSPEHNFSTMNSPTSLDGSMSSSIKSENSTSKIARKESEVSIKKAKQDEYMLRLYNAGRKVKPPSEPKPSNPKRSVINARSVKILHDAEEKLKNESMNLHESLLLRSINNMAVAAISDPEEKKLQYAIEHSRLVLAELQRKQQQEFAALKGTEPETALPLLLNPTQVGIDEVAAEDDIFRIVRAAITKVDDCLDKSDLTSFVDNAKYYADFIGTENDIATIKKNVDVIVGGGFYDRYSKGVANYTIPSYTDIILKSPVFQMPQLPQSYIDSTPLVVNSVMKSAEFTRFQLQQLQDRDENESLHAFSPPPAVEVKVVHEVKNEVKKEMKKKKGEKFVAMDALQLVTATPEPSISSTITRVSKEPRVKVVKVPVRKQTTQKTDIINRNLVIAKYEPFDKIEALTKQREALEQLIMDNLFPNGIPTPEKAKLAKKSSKWKSKSNSPGKLELPMQTLGRLAVDMGKYSALERELVRLEKLEEYIAKEKNRQKDSTNEKDYLTSGRVSVTAEPTRIIKPARSQARVSAVVSSVEETTPPPKKKKKSTKKAVSKSKDINNALSVVSSNIQLSPRTPPVLYSISEYRTYNQVNSGGGSGHAVSSDDVIPVVINQSNEEDHFLGDVGLRDKLFTLSEKDKVYADEMIKSSPL